MDMCVDLKGTKTIDLPVEEFRRKPVPKDTSGHRSSLEKKKDTGYRQMGFP